MTVLFHESESLGAGISVLRVADRLVELGWSAAGWFPENGPLVSESALTFSEHTARFKPIAFSLQGWRKDPGPLARMGRTPGYLGALRSWLRATRPDVVHANSLLVLPEATVARRLGLPVVMQVHEIPQQTPKRAWALRWAAAVSDVLVGVSEPVSAMLREQAGETPVLTVHNGVPLPAVPVRPETDEIVVGSVGYVSRTKGTDVFVRAAELVLRERPGTRFEHAGASRLWGDDSFDGAVAALASSARLQASFTWLGRTDVPKALARWQLFVLASRQEAFPLSTLEAMAAGLPVIATNVGGLPEQIEHLETGVLVPPESPSALAEWIVRLGDDPVLRERLGDAARRRVERSFTLDAQATGLAAAYELALARRRSRPGLRRRSRVVS